MLSRISRKEIKVGTKKRDQPVSKVNPGEVNDPENFGDESPTGNRLLTVAELNEMREEFKRDDAWAVEELRKNPIM